jgi:hypothetical protein
MGHAVLEAGERVSGRLVSHPGDRTVATRCVQIQPGEQQGCANP